VDEGRGRLKEGIYPEETTDIMDTDTRGVKWKVKNGRIYHKMNQLGRNIKWGITGGGGGGGEIIVIIILPILYIYSGAEIYQRHAWYAHNKLKKEMIWWSREGIKGKRKVLTHF
jgi:hypothetical protein